MKKILVVYYSRTGFTRSVAKLISQACDADLEQIEDADNLNSTIGYLISALDAVMHLETPIKASQFDPGGYDVVVIGTPIWVWNMAIPIRTYIKQNRGKFRRVALFCTGSVTAQKRVLRDLERLIGRPALAKLAITEEEIADRSYNGRLTTFISMVKTSSLLRTYQGYGLSDHTYPVITQNSSSRRNSGNTSDHIGEN